MNPARAIAAAIVTSLQAQSWAAGLKIVRAYRADWDLKNLSDGVTKVTVLISEQEDERETRKDLDSDYTIRILIQKKLSMAGKVNADDANDLELAAVDPMLDLFDDIGRCLFELKTAGPGRWMSSKPAPISDADLKNVSCYCAMRAITYRVFGDALPPLEVVGPSGLEYLEVSP